MDIHKPKPWHGWREFLKEYGIIVLGVLTALAAEQVVENLHWQERTRTTNETLRENLKLASGPVQAALILEPCDEDVLGRLERSLVAPSDEWRPPFLIRSGADSEVFSSPVFMLESEEWRNAQADGTANHFPSRTQALYAIVYDRLAAIQASNTEMALEIAEINSLSIPRHIDAQSKTNYLRLIYRIRADLKSSMFRSLQFLQATKELGIKIADPKDDQIVRDYQQVCSRLKAGETNVVIN
jgi:hypothetical protein